MTNKLHNLIYIKYSFTLILKIPWHDISKLESKSNIAVADYVEITDKIAEYAALKGDIVQKTGAWYSFNGEKIGQGRENVKIYLKENNKVYKQIEIEVKNFLGSNED